MKQMILIISLISQMAFASDPFATLGVYRGAGTDGKNKIPAYETWLGKPIFRALDFLPQTTWANIVGTTDWVSDSWKCSKRMTISIPMLPNDKVSTLAIGATGQYNDYFKHIAEKLVARGLGNSILRIGWEFNGGWYAWRADKDPANWVKFFQQIVTTMRSVPESHFKIDWNISLGQLGIKAEKAYPGDAYVDIIGIDVYNQWWDVLDKDPKHRWLTLVNQNNGLAWQKAFALSHKKQISFPEWGTGTRPDGHGGGDDPYFIEQMYNWIKANDVAYHNYWEYPAPDYNAELAKDKLPLSAAKFKALFNPPVVTPAAVK